jgi:hypothetical protein
VDLAAVQGPAVPSRAVALGLRHPDHAVPFRPSVAGRIEALPWKRSHARIAARGSGSHTAQADVEGNRSDRTASPLDRPT